MIVALMSSSIRGRPDLPVLDLGLVGTPSSMLRIHLRNVEQLTIEIRSLMRAPNFLPWRTSVRRS